MTALVTDGLPVMDGARATPRNAAVSGPFARLSQANFAAVQRTLRQRGARVAGREAAAFVKGGDDAIDAANRGPERKRPRLAPGPKLVWLPGRFTA